jgi:peptide/nickel transport system substrate-binding protein
VRHALTIAFDFEWMNRNLSNNAYERTESFWQNSSLSSYGVAASPEELALLGDLKSGMAPDFLNGTYKLPVSDASGRDRKILRQAVDLFAAAGYHIKGGHMTGADGTPVTFELMTQNADQEKVALTYQRTLKAIGVDMTVRTVDDSSYQQRSQSFDYDMIIKSYTSSLSPGLEQVGRWGSQSRDLQGSENFAGVADPGIDRIIEAILNERSESGFETAVRALDRVLMSRYYVIPLYHIGEQWIAHKKNIHHPAATPLYGAQLPVWWDENG